ncbi:MULTISPECIES: ParB/RepB/Spo0J family partition protein [unclassified Neomoorella]|uniref:ParB/RepB/Spo0J family partition protein n=1 Tax=unclassified Neomoorella TaxID=2676739 RepID=UPI00155B1FE6|nr:MULTISPECIES: ParB N-terminal domain-containing protein [unclassified Moorella (in: firmicutes)]
MIALSNLVSTSLLKPHPKNGEYFSAPSPEEREAIKRSIQAQGIRDPLKVLPDYTVIAGHVRLEIAKELGIEKVPVEVWDVSPEEAEYLLVADNEERRICNDPIKKAKRAEFLKRYWGIREGRPEKLGKNYPVFKTLDDVANAIGENRENLKKLLKLNDLIPEFQQFVSQGKLSQIAAYSLAFLPPGEQRQLLDILGESGVCGLSVKEAQNLRREIEAERKRAEELARKLAESEKALADAKEGSDEAARLKAEIDALRKENGELKARQPEIVEKVVEKVVYKTDPKMEIELNAARVKLQEFADELASVRSHAEFLAQQRQELLTKIERIKKEKETLERHYETVKKSLIQEKSFKEKLPEIPLKAEFDRVTSLTTEFLLVTEKIMRAPDKVKEYVRMMKSAGIVESSDAEKALGKLVRDIEVLFGARLHVLGLQLLAVRATELLDLLNEGLTGKKQLKVLEGGKKHETEIDRKNLG